MAIYRLILKALAIALSGLLVATVSGCHLGTPHNDPATSARQPAEQEGRSSVVIRTPTTAAKAVADVLDVIDHDMELDRDRSDDTYKLFGDSTIQCQRRHKSAAGVNSTSCLRSSLLLIGRAGSPSRADATIELQFDAESAVTPSFRTVAALVSHRWTPSPRGNTAMILLVTTGSAYSTVCFQFDASAHLRRINSLTYRRTSDGLPYGSGNANAGDPCAEPEPAPWRPVTPVSTTLSTATVPKSP